MRLPLLAVRNVLAALVLVVVGLGSRDARAEEPRIHAILGTGHAVGNPQAHEFGFGGYGGFALEYPLGKMLGVQLEIGTSILPHANPPEDPKIADHGAGLSIDGLLGVRLRPFGARRVAGLWLDVNGGVDRTGALNRPVFDAHLGYDFRIKGPGRWDVGPFLGYTQVFQPDDTLRPEDAHVLWLGVHVALGARSERLRGDRDKDGVFDDEDACPDTPGARTADRRTSGCPDRDKDGVHDKEDACPDVPGVRTEDPKTNGCPRPDRDKDGVFDDEDACPDVPGPRTSVPATNGCPSGDQVHVEGDQILQDDVIHFETGSPRVRHASWPVVKQVAKFINSSPDLVEINIEGHADEVGTGEYNMYLSEQRALSVKALLVKYGVDPSRLTTHAYGKTRPIAVGHAEEQRRLNRRVEFTITQARKGSN